MTSNLMKPILSMLLLVVSVVSLFSGCTNESMNSTTTVAPDLSTQGATETTAPVLFSDVDNVDVPSDAYYKNKLAINAPDPFILKYGDTYYLYNTGTALLTVRTSKDLVNWSSSKVIFSVTNTSWALTYCWAPEVYHYNDKFYLFYSAKPSVDSVNYHCGVAVCDTPDGTFMPVSDEPLINFPFRTIDISFFVDDDGRTYVFYSKDQETNIIDGIKTSQTYGAEVTNDLTTLIGEPVLISTPTEAWELESGAKVWNEGPVVFKENGKYYLLYTANHFRAPNYAVGYCTSDEVLGFYDKPKDGRILAAKGEIITGPGHCNILRCEDEIYLVYHAHTIPPNDKAGRSLYIDKLVIKEDGTLWVNGPTNTKQPLPNGVNGYYKYDAEVEVTGTLKNENQDLRILYDGMTPKNGMGIVEVDDADSITLKFPEGQKFDLMWVYSSDVASHEIASADIIVNDQYLFNDIEFSGVGSEIIINFEGLPEDTLIQELTLSFTMSENSVCSGIGEIIFSEKK